MGERLLTQHRKLHHRAQWKIILLALTPFFCVSSVINSFVHLYMFILSAYISLYIYRERARELYLLSLYIYIVHSIYYLSLYPCTHVCTHKRTYIYTYIHMWEGVCSPYSLIFNIFHKLTKDYCISMRKFSDSFTRVILIVGAK